MNAIHASERGTTVLYCSYICLTVYAKEEAIASRQFLTLTSNHPEGKLSTKGIFTGAVK